MNQAHARDPIATDHPAKNLIWRNAFWRLGPDFHTELPAKGVPQSQWVDHSADCAARLGLPHDWHSDAAWNGLAVMSGQALWPGMQPLASVYSGHQFGVWAGQLGDGRALWLGEVLGPGGALELQLKGAGDTPYSRRADGRAVLRSSVREFLCSEAMHHLGIPTTRALSMVSSPLPVRREEIETAAVVCRVAPSFIRFGHFEHFAHTHAPRPDEARLQQLLDFLLEHHFPELRAAPCPALAYLETITRKTARLMAQWQAVGFCHGVMNTDNMSALGLTLDYGPFGFLDAYDPGHICNHSDHQGRYAYARQPQIGWWNLHALAQALLPLIPEGAENPRMPRVEAALEVYRAEYLQAWSSLMLRKLGLIGPQEESSLPIPEDTASLIDDWLGLLAAQGVDYTLAHRRLSNWPDAEPELKALFKDAAPLQDWLERYARALEQVGRADPAERSAQMRAVNPKYILRNHLAENAIRSARTGDYSEVRRLHHILQRPFDEQPEHEAYADLPPAWACGLEISCSS